MYRSQAERSQTGWFVGIRSVVLVVLFAQGLLVAQASRPGRLNPPHLNEMPLVERVMREFDAPNPQDAAARRMGAFAQLQEVLEELSSGRTAVGTETPDEKRILTEYRNAYFEIQATILKTPADDKLIPVLRRFDEDPAMREDLLTKFFSPALQTQSRNVSKTLQARRAAMRQSQAAFGGTAIATPPAAAAPAAAKPNAAASKPAVTKAVAPEPSIAKATAAKVDTKAFGLQLGDPLNLPKCASIIPTVTCTVDDFLGIEGLIGAMIGAELDGKILTLRVPTISCPDWTTCTVVAIVDDAGRLISLTAITAGNNVEQIAVRELRAKYGLNTSTQEHFQTSDSGNQIKSLDYDWALPGLHVRFEPVFGKPTEGRLIIETEEVQRRGKAKQNQRKL